MKRSWEEQAVFGLTSREVFVRVSQLALQGRPPAPSYPTQKGSESWPGIHDLSPGNRRLGQGGSWRWSTGIVANVESKVKWLEITRRVQAPSEHQKGRNEDEETEMLEMREVRVITIEELSVW